MQFKGKNQSKGNRYDYGGSIPTAFNIAPVNVDIVITVGSAVFMEETHGMRNFVNDITVSTNNATICVSY